MVIRSYYVFSCKTVWSWCVSSRIILVIKLGLEVFFLYNIYILQKITTNADLTINFEMEEQQPLTFSEIWHIPRTLVFLGRWASLLFQLAMYSRSGAVFSLLPRSSSQMLRASCLWKDDFLALLLGNAVYISRPYHLRHYLHDDQVAFSPKQAEYFRKRDADAEKTFSRLLCGFWLAIK